MRGMVQEPSKLMQYGSGISFHKIACQTFLLILSFKSVEKKKDMLYCPRCGSSNVDWILPQIWSKWVCRDCGYIGALIIEDGEIAAELRKEWKEKYGTP